MFDFEPRHREEVQRAFNKSAHTKGADLVTPQIISDGPIEYQTTDLDTALERTSLGRAFLGFIGLALSIREKVRGLTSKFEK